MLFNNATEISMRRGSLEPALRGDKAGRRIRDPTAGPVFADQTIEGDEADTLYNINPTKLENLIHEIFDPARIDIEIKDCFDNPFVPRKWFLVPPLVIHEDVEKIKNWTISDDIYDPQTARMGIRDNISIRGDE